MCEPARSADAVPRLEQERNATAARRAPTRRSSPPDAGWSPDFIPELNADAVDMKVIRGILTIAGPDAIKCSKDLAQKGRDFRRHHGGRDLCGALQVAATRRRASTSSAAARSASANSRPRCSLTSRRHDS